MSPVTLTLSTLAAAGALVGGVWSTVQTADSRYQPAGEYVTAAEFKNVEWSLLRRELRDAEREAEENPRDADAQEDYAEVLDLWCRTFPDDRRCDA